MKVESSDARKMAALAMSSTMPARGTGWFLAVLAFIASASESALSGGRPSALAKMPVAMPPGEIEFTRTFFSPSCMATHTVRWFTAALAAP